ncbi:MAG: PAS domain S-box protein [Flavobacteriales bacterium]|nr:PAS domain S-box protein [Flavobacteriales bacterium]
MEISIDHISTLRSNLFPFHISFGEDAVIHETGSSIHKVFGDLKGKFFFEEFSIIRPYFPNWDIDRIKSNFETACFLKSPTHDLIMRGQFMQHATSGDITFYGSIWLNSIEVLETEKLVINDFALHDPTYDFVHILKQLEIQGEELRQLLHRVKEKTSQLQVSETKYRNFLDNASEMIYRIDPDGKILYANPKFISRISFPQSDYLGKNIFEIITEKYREGFKENIQQLDKANVPSIFTESQVINFHNELLWFGQSIQRVQTENVDEFMVFAIDITTQKKNEAEIIESNKQLELLTLLINQTADALHVTDESGQLYYINEKESIRLQLPIDQCRSHKIQDVDPRFSVNDSWHNHLSLVKKKEYYNRSTTAISPGVTGIFLLRLFRNGPPLRGNRISSQISVTSVHAKIQRNNCWRPNKYSKVYCWKCPT